MSWFRAHRAAAPASAPPEDAAEPEVHPSLALTALLAELRPDRPLRLLDLGPAVGANIAFWSERLPCSVQVADLHRSLAEVHPGTDPEPAVRAALPEVRPGEPPLDLVLAWGLLDYLDRPRIRALAAALAPRCRPGARWFAMVRIGKEIPREPGSYLIRPDGSLVYRLDSAHTRPGPRHRPSEIEAATPGFTTDRNFLLRHGVQEYLLVRDEPDQAA